MRHADSCQRLQTLKKKDHLRVQVHARALQPASTDTRPLATFAIIIIEVSIAHDL
jgi:hypothetical protein